MFFQGLHSVYAPLWHIYTISQKLAKEQRSGPWWIFLDKIRILHPEVEVQLFHGIFFQGTKLKPFLKDLTKKCPCNYCTSSCLHFHKNSLFLLPLLAFFIAIVCHCFGTSPVFQATWHIRVSQPTQSCSKLLTFQVKYYLHQRLCQLSKI